MFLYLYLYQIHQKYSGGVMGVEEEALETVEEKERRENIRLVDNATTTTAIIIITIIIIIIIIIVIIIVIITAIIITRPRPRWIVG